MKIVKLLNTIHPNVYFNNIFECLFGSREYRITQSFLRKIESIGLSNSKETGEIKINLIGNNLFKITCKKPFFFKKNFNSFQNMCIFKKKIFYVYKTISKFIDISNEYINYTNTILDNTKTILIHKNKIIK